jgi:hypothetical protein
MPGKNRGTAGTGASPKPCNNNKRIHIMRTPGIDCRNNAVDLISGYPGSGNIVSPDAMALDQCLPDEDPVSHLDIFKSHQVSSCCIYGDAPKAVAPELFVLFNEHIDNFPARLTETYEKYFQTETPSTGLNLTMIVISLSPFV